MKTQLIILLAAALFIGACQQADTTGTEPAAVPTGQAAGYCSAEDARSRSTVYRQIKAAVDEIRLIDTHEHLVSEGLWLTHEVDFFYWFSHYSSSDLLSAGMPPDDLSFIRDPQNPSQERWSRMAPYWPLVKYTGYGQALRIAARDIYGIPDIDESTWSDLSERISAARQPGFYEKILRQKAGIELAILDCISDDPYITVALSGDGGRQPTFFVRVKQLDNFVRLNNDRISNLEVEYEQEIKSLDDVLAALDKAFDRIIAKGYVGIKSSLAYSRILRYEDTSREEAGRAFEKLLAGEESFEQLRPYQDFLMHQIVRRAGEHGLPVQIHTGLLEGKGNIITNSKPTHLVNLFMKYPETKFDIFHGSFPYMGELATLAKNFQNVYINMCWLPIISPTASKLWLHQWLETVPVNKIMGFGGDYLFVEGTYGHSVIARHVVAETLAEKVEAGYLTLEEAQYVARRILRDNAIDLFRLERFL